MGLACCGGLVCGRTCVRRSPPPAPRRERDTPQQFGDDTIGSATCVDTTLAACEILDTMPATTYGEHCSRAEPADVDHAGDVEEAQCALCLAVFRPDTPVRVTPCKHVFCAACLERQISCTVGNGKLQCSLCRTSFVGAV